MNKPDAILVGDIHYRDSQPACRLDDFWETQACKSSWLRELWDFYGRPPILQPGDLFHHWKSSPRVINAVMQLLPPMITMPGNPGKHNYFTADGLDRDALYTLFLSNSGWDVLFSVVQQKTVFGKNFPITVSSVEWGKDAESLQSSGSFPNVLITHRMILDGPAAFDGEHGLDFLKRTKGYNLILTGHNHKPMVFVHKKRLLVNPGSFTRQTADETHEPRVYLWYAKENEVKPVYVPIEKDVMTREHIDSVKIPDQRIVAFVESLAEGKIDSTVRFVDNMMQFIQNPKLKQRVKDRLLEAIDNG